MRTRALNAGCAVNWRRANRVGWSSNALLVLHMWGPLPLWPALAALTYASWHTALAYAHDGWVRGWWWRTTDHQCPGDDGDDDEFEPPPDDPDDDETADHDTPTIRIRSTYTLAA